MIARERFDRQFFGGHNRICDDERTFMGDCLHLANHYSGVNDRK